MTSLLIALILLSSIYPSAILAGSPAATLVGTWIQEEMGPVLTHERVYRFNADGTYVFMFTARNTGSIDRRTLVRQSGKFRVSGDRLVIAPKGGTARTYLWRVEKDPYVGDLRLVLVLPNGTLDIYYRQ